MQDKRNTYVSKFSCLPCICYLLHANGNLPGIGQAALKHIGEAFKFVGVCQTVVYSLVSLMAMRQIFIRDK
jgi:hypothetical protein